jgi:hypothetical protein
MAEYQRMTAWSTPKLIVIARNRSEERVLYVCKSLQSGANTVMCYYLAFQADAYWCNILTPS